MTTRLFGLWRPEIAWTNRRGGISREFAPLSQSSRLRGMNPREDLSAAGAEWRRKLEEAGIRVPKRIAALTNAGHTLPHELAIRWFQTFFRPIAIEEMVVFTGAMTRSTP